MIGAGRALLLALAAALAVVYVSCGGGGGSPEVAPTAIASLQQTTSAPATESIQPTAEPQLETRGPPPTSKCSDPYSGSAPYKPTPGQPLRLRPTGDAPPLARFQVAPAVQDDELDGLLRKSIGGNITHFAVVVKNLSDGKGVSIAPDRKFYAASLFKTWVMLEAFHQRDGGLLSFDERYVVSDYYDQYRLNAGELEACSQVTPIDALRAMMSVSDNVAANLMYDRVGYSTTNQTLRDLGLTQSGLVQGGDLTTSARDMALLVEALARGQAVSPGASEEMIALMESETINDRLPALLPAGTPIAHKTGNWDNATHDVGIVFGPRGIYVIAVLTDYGFSADGTAAIARLSKVVYDYYNPD